MNQKLIGPDLHRPLLVFELQLTAGHVVGVLVPHRAGDPKETRRIAATFGTLLFPKGQPHATLANMSQSRFLGDGVFTQVSPKKNPAE